MTNIIFYCRSEFIFVLWNYDYIMYFKNYVHSRSNHLVISSASIMFQRFMMCQAFQNHDRFIVCATCIFLAGKVEEQPKRLKDVVDVFLLIRSKVQNKFLESVSSTSWFCELPFCIAAIWMWT